MDVSVKLDFPAEYSVEVVHDLPPTGEQIRLPLHGDDYGDGISMRVTPKTHPS